MFEFIAQIKTRNETLYQFGWWCLVASILFLVLSKFSSTQVYNVSAWYKPFKFALSTCAYAWTMAWFCHYLPDFNVRNFNWAVIVLLGFEIVYIALQAYRGQLSHYNTSTPLYAALFSMMALAATAVTIYTAYVGILFCTNEFPELPRYYLWSIRLGIFLFVIFSFEGFVMGSKLSHTIGGPDGGPGIPVLNWSTQFGDPRVAHFIGMHALQVVPLLAYYLLKNTKATFVLALLYGLLAVFTLVQALKGRSLFRAHQAATEQGLSK
jgi:hypothetical protein